MIIDVEGAGGSLTFGPRGEPQGGKPGLDAGDRVPFRGPICYRFAVPNDPMTGTELMRAPRLPVLLPLLAFCAAAQIPSFRASLDTNADSYFWNFSPLYALTLFCAATYRSWGWMLAAPLGAYLLGDVGVWIASRDAAAAFHPVQLLAYLGLLGIAACGWRLRGRERSLERVGLAAIGGSLCFFVLTNFGSWLVDPLLPTPTGYARNLGGLLQSFVLAVPFAKLEFASMLGFSALFFSPLGVRALSVETSPSRGRVTAPAVHAATAGEAV